MSDQPTPDEQAVAGPVDEDLSYEAAREELAEVVRRLEAGGTDLETSLTLWERGEQLARICQRRLEGARRRLDDAMAAEQRADGREQR